MTSSINPEVHFAPPDDRPPAVAPSASTQPTIAARDNANVDPPMSLLRKQQPSNTAASTFITVSNKASGYGRQIITEPSNTDLNVRHESNISKDYAFQHIGIPHSDALQQQKEKLDGSARFGFGTKGNKATDRGSQRVFAPNEQGKDTMHENNVSEGHAEQDIGIPAQLSAKIYAEATQSSSPSRVQKFLNATAAIFKSKKKISTTARPSKCKGLAGVPVEAFFLFYLPSMAEYLPYFLEP